MDSGYSRHMTGNKSVLTDYHEEKGPSVTFGGNGKGQTRGFGTLTNRSTVTPRNSETTKTFIIQRKHGI